MSLLKPEKTALLSLIIIFVISSLSIILIGKENYWFSKVLHFHTVLSSAEGLNTGTKVTISGLKAGKITSLTPTANSEIRVDFIVFKDHEYRITKDSYIQVHRNFLLGEKKIILQPGKKKEVLKEFSYIKNKPVLDLVDLISPKKINKLVLKIENMTQLLNRSVIVLERMDNKLIKSNLITNTLRDTRKVLHPFKKSNKEIKELITTTHKLSKKLDKNSAMTDDIELALKEMITTLKALQQTWILEDHVQKVKEEKK